MKKLILNLVHVVIFTNSMQVPHLTPYQLRADIQSKAATFAEERSTITSKTPHWEQAYMAYVSHKIRQGEKSLEDILKIIIPSRNYDEPLLPYWDKTFSQWIQQEKEIEANWKFIYENWDSIVIKLKTK